jgi:hypothetical protein
MENETKILAYIRLKTLGDGRLKALQKVFISRKFMRQIEPKIELHFDEK